MSSDADPASIASMIAWLVEHVDDAADDGTTSNSEDSLPDIILSSGSLTGSDIDSDDLASELSLEQTHVMDAREVNIWIVCNLLFGLFITFFVFWIVFNSPLFWIIISLSLVLYLTLSFVLKLNFV